MGTGLLEMDWARRLVLLLAGAFLAILLGLALSFVLARPAGAATLPLPLPLALPTPTVLPPVGTAPLAAPAADIVSATHSLPPVPQSPALPVPPTPVAHLPIPPLPVTTRPSSPTATGIPAAGTPAIVPATGQPAHHSTVTGSSARHAGENVRAARHALGDTPPVLPPAHLPLPFFPFASGSAGVVSAPGHGQPSGNAIPLTVLLLALAGIGGVFLKRRLAPKLLFGSRFAPPG